MTATETRRELARAFTRALQALELAEVLAEAGGCRALALTARSLSAQVIAAWRVARKPDRCSDCGKTCGTASESPAVADGARCSECGPVLRCETCSEAAEAVPLALCQAHREVSCADCQGTGIGWHGPDSSCPLCAGSGVSS